MKKLNILFKIAAVALITLCAFPANALNLGNPKSIKIGDKEYVFSYDSEGRLSTVSSSNLIFYSITYPKSNEILEQEGTINDKNQFEPLFINNIRLPYSGNSFEVNSSFTFSDSKFRYDIKKEGRTDLKTYGIDVELKWSGKSVSQIKYDKDILKFKYNSYEYEIPRNGWDWLGFIMSKVLPEVEILNYWYVGRTFYPFHKYPKEVEENINGRKSSVLFEYYIVSPKEMTIEMKNVVNGSMTNRTYIKVNY